jgi:predicted signal transduction protein with EAL and GGDEF domain
MSTKPSSQSVSSGSAEMDWKQRLAGFLGNKLDSDFRRQMFEYAQRYDIQTGLLNYHSFQESLARIVRERGDDREIALLWIEIHNLRREFALWGRRGSDALITHIAECLRSAAAPETLLGRFSGRCFLVAMEVKKNDVDDRRRIQRMADSLVPMRSAGSRGTLESSAGVAFFPTDTESSEDLARFASLAASHAHYIKSPSVVVFEEKMNWVLMRDHMLEVELHKAIADSCLTVAYQPKIEVATGIWLGLETLVRWHHPKWGAIPPGEFIPVAERSELIQQILDLTLRKALEDARHWNRMGLAIPMIAVNCSWANMRREDFASRVRDLLEEIPIEPTLLELEVTESVLLDDEKLFGARVRQLKSHGIRIAIDDFGTRYTGFDLLRQLNLDAMKIDRCFVRGIDHSPEMRSLCETIVAMAKQLKLRTVAEGVEELGELRVLKEIGCDAAQGFLFERPMPAAEVAETLRNWPAQLAELGYGDDLLSSRNEPEPAREIS